MSRRSAPRRGMSLGGLRGDRRQSGVDRRSELVYDLVDMPLFDDERRCNKDVVAAAAVDGAPHRIDEQPTLHRFALDPRVQAQGGIERRLARAIGDQLDAAEQAPAADIADMGMIAKASREPHPETFAL